MYHPKDPGYGDSWETYDLPLTFLRVWVLAAFCAFLFQGVQYGFLEDCSVLTLCIDTSITC